MGMPIVGVIFIILIVLVICLWNFPKLVGYFDKAENHFNLKDEDYEENSKEETNENQSEN